MQTTYISKVSNGSAYNLHPLWSFLFIISWNIMIISKWTTLIWRLLGTLLPIYFSLVFFPRNFSLNVCLNIVITVLISMFQSPLLKNIMPLLKADLCLALQENKLKRSFTEMWILTQRALYSAKVTLHHFWEAEIAEFSSICVRPWGRHWNRGSPSLTPFPFLCNGKHYCVFLKTFWVSEMKDNKRKEGYCFVIKMKTDKFLLSKKWLYLWQDCKRMLF